MAPNLIDSFISPINFYFHFTIIVSLFLSFVPANLARDLCLTCFPQSQTDANLQPVKRLMFRFHADFGTRARLQTWEPAARLNCKRHLFCFIESTVEPGFNEPLFNEVLDIMKGIFYVPAKSTSILKK